MRQSQKETAVQRSLQGAAADRREALALAREADAEFAGDEFGSGFRSGRKCPPSSRG